MSVYSIKGKGWRYDFVLAGQRYTEAWFTTKRKAQAAEADKRGSSGKWGGGTWFGGFRIPNLVPVRLSI